MGVARSRDTPGTDKTSKQNKFSNQSGTSVCERITFDHGTDHYTEHIYSKENCNSVAKSKKFFCVPTTLSVLTSLSFKFGALFWTKGGNSLNRWSTRGSLAKIHQCFLTNFLKYTKMSENVMTQTKRDNLGDTTLGFNNLLSMSLTLSWQSSTILLP